MKSVFLLLLPAVLYAQLEGKVTSSATHGGLPAVGINVTSTTGRRITYTGVTEDDGSFHISAIDQDGDYVVTFVHGGYRDFASHVRITAAAPPPKMQVELSPLASLRGRVLDAEGHPIANAPVQLLSVSGDWAWTATTTKDGTFTYQNGISTPAFVLRAVPPAALAPPPSAKNEPRVWAPTYYPDGLDRSQAVPIIWRGDSDLDGYTIKLRVVPVFHVRGTVVDDAGKRVQGASVKLTSPDLPLPIALNAADTQTTTASDGTFDMSSVRPGEWILTGESKRGSQVLRHAVRGTISRTDWNDARIRLQAPFPVRFIVDRPDDSLVSFVELTPTDHLSMPHASPPGATGKGTFEIPDVYSGEYRVSAQPPSGGFYLDSIKMGVREILGQAVELADGSLPIQVIYKNNGGRVQGTVEHCSDVVLAPTDPILQRAGLLRTASCSDSGHFEINSLRPGDYYLAVYDRRPVLDQTLLAALPSAADTITVKAGQSTLAAVRLTSLPGQ